MVSSLTHILRTACSTAVVVDQALNLAAKFVVDFVIFFSSKTVKGIRNLYVLTDLNFTIPATSTAYISLEWIQFRPNYVIFYFSSASM